MFGLRRTPSTGRFVAALSHLYRFFFPPRQYGFLADVLAGVKQVLEDRPAPFEIQKASGNRVEARSGHISLKVRFGYESVWEKREERFVARDVFRIHLDSPALPQGLRFLEESDSGEDVLTGDSTFDDAVEVLGDPSIILALFDAPLRKSTQLFVALGGSFAARQIALQSIIGLTYYDIPRALRLALDIADRLLSTEGGGVYARLARNALEDPKPGVRLAALLRLQEQFPLLAQARETSVAALADANPWVRISGARFLKSEAIPVLKTMLEDRDLPDDAAAEVVSLAATRVPEGEAGSLLAPLLKSRTGETQRRAIECLGRLHYQPAAAALLVILERSNPRTAATAANALAALGYAAAEPALLQAVAQDAGELRLAAARALGEIGGVHAVEPLLALLGRKRRGSDTTTAIRDAIASIQSRLAGAGAGQLSLASDPEEGGRLSLAEPVAGRGDVSLVAKEN